MKVSLKENPNNISLCYQISAAHFNESAGNSKLVTSKDIFNDRWIEVNEQGQEIYSICIGLVDSEMLKVRKMHWKHAQAGRIARDFLDE